jgi:NADH-quinone oxidoreductase subunit C
VTESILTMADGESTIRAIESEFPGAVLSTGSYRSQHWAELAPERLLEVCHWLRDDPSAGYTYLVDVTAVHWPDDPLPTEVVYHLYSLERDDRLRLKVRVPLVGPVPSVSAIWKSAEWNERETYDMFGVEFRGHPDPRRILMPDDYTDFPLRKELPLYRG